MVCVCICVCVSQLRKRMLEALRDCPEDASPLSFPELLCHYAAMNATWAAAALLTRLVARLLTSRMGLGGVAALGLVAAVSVLITVGLYVYYVYIIGMGGKREGGEGGGGDERRGSSGRGSGSKKSK